MTELTRQEMDAKLAASEAKVDARLANFDTSVKTGFAELRAEMEKMRAEMHKGMMDIVRWVIGVGLASIGAILAISRMADKPPAQASIQPAPIIVTIPQAAAAPAGLFPERAK